MKVVQRVPGLVRGNTMETAEHGLGAEMSIGRHFRVRPLSRFESSVFFDLMGPPQRRMAFVGKRRCQATGGLFCLQERERCGLCVDENQGGTTSLCRP